MRRVAVQPELDQGLLRASRYTTAGQLLTARRVSRADASSDE